MMSIIKIYLNDFDVFFKSENRYYEVINYDTEAFINKNKVKNGLSRKN